MPLSMPLTMPRRTRFVVALAATALLVAGCRGGGPAQPHEVVQRFYTMREAAGVFGAPTAEQLRALQPFIADTLARLLAAADSVRSADKRAAPSEKPRFTDGDLFSSLFEGPTTVTPQAAVGRGDTVRVAVRLTNDQQKPPVVWSDTAIVVRQRGEWRLLDLHFGGTWEFGSHGSLLRQLSPPYQ
jgi:hypothetical protein